MKRFLTLSLTVAMTAVPQQPTPRELKHCYLEATNVSNYDELKSHWESGWGSYDREQFHRLALKIRVGTTDSAGGLVKVDWFWVGRKMIDNAFVIYGRGSKELEIPRTYFTECFAVAPEINQRDRNYVLINQRYVSGARHEGWVVCVRDPKGRVLAAKGSSEPMLQLFRSSSEFDRL